MGGFCRCQCPGLIDRGASHLRSNPNAIALRLPHGAVKFNVRLDHAEQMVSVMLTAFVAIALIAGGAFADSGEKADVNRSIRADANPSMNVALWYVPAEVNGALLASRALSRDANPSMDVARWYAPVDVDGLVLASRALLEDANPSMNVARWYGPVQANGALIASQALNSGAHPSMNVALWCAPVQSDFEVLLCLAEGAGQLCQ